MWTLLVLISIILMVIYYIRHKLKYRQVNNLPGPPLKWFIGNGFEFGSNIVETFEYTQQLIKSYGRIARIWMGPFRLWVYVTDPDMVDFFLSSTVYTKKSSEYKTLKSWLGDGLVTSEGETWKKFRRILTPAFHFKILEKFPEIFHKNMQTLIETFKKEQGDNVDVCKPIRRYAMDVLCETSMGTNFNCQVHGDNEYIKSIHKFMEIYLKSRFYSFWNNFDFIFKHTQAYIDLKKCIDTIQNITMQVIQKRKVERIKNDDEDSPDNFGIKNRKVFMDIIIDAPGLTDQETIWHVDTFFLAGHHTVSSAMSMALYELAKHDEIQKKLLEEIHDVVGMDRTKIIQFADLKEMNYLDRVIKEVLRLYPPVPTFARELGEDVVYNGITIPANTRICFHPYSQHRDPELFPDPEKFDPDRFLPENTVRRHPFAYIPFSAGPRNCIGLRYAMMNVEIMVANVIRQFKICPADFPHKPVIGNDGILRFVNGLPVKLVYRD